MAEREQVGASLPKIIFVCARMFHRFLVEQKQANFHSKCRRGFFGGGAGGEIDLRKWED